MVYLRWSNSLEVNKYNTGNKHILQWNQTNIDRMKQITGNRQILVEWSVTLEVNKYWYNEASHWKQTNNDGMMQISLEAIKYWYNEASHWEQTNKIH